LKRFLIKTVLNTNYCLKLRSRRKKNTDEEILQMCDALTAEFSALCDTDTKGLKLSTLKRTVMPIVLKAHNDVTSLDDLERYRIKSSVHRLLATDGFVKKSFNITSEIMEEIETYLAKTKTKTSLE